MAAATNPLSREDLARIQTALRGLNESIAGMDKAEQCGVDCQAAREEAQLRTKRLLEYIKVYFPNEVTP